MEIHVITGRIGRDAEARTVGDKLAIGFSVAVDHSYIDRNGEKVNKSTWYDCTLWRKPGQDGILKYLKKGTQVTVHGDEVTADTYAGNDSTTRVSLRLKVVQVEPKWSDAQAPASPSVTNHPNDDVPF